MSSQMQQIKAIKDALKRHQVSKLRELSIRHGFINDKLRKKAWPLVLGIETTIKPKSSNTVNTPHIIPLPEHSEHTYSTLRPPPISTNNSNRFSLQINAKLPEISESKSSKSTPIVKLSLMGTPESQQIDKDISRSSLKYYNLSKGKSRSEASLSKILHDLFDSSSELHYIQGFNDVASVLLAVCGNERLAQRILRRIAQTLLSDYIMIDAHDTINVINHKLIFDILSTHDKLIFSLLDNAYDFISVSISWLLTWFAHQVTDLALISRIYDYCLCSDKLISSYLSAALMVHLKQDLLLAAKEEVTLFEYFNELQWNKLEWNDIIALSEDLYSAYGEELNEAFKQSVEASNNLVGGSGSLRSDVWLTDSTDSPVPITPQTPWTPSVTPRMESSVSRKTSDGEGGFSAFDSVDFELLKQQRKSSESEKGVVVEAHMQTEDEVEMTRKTRKKKKKKKKLGKAIKGFIDDYFGNYDHVQVPQ